MLSLNTWLPVILIFMMVPLALQWVVRSRTAGKMLCAIVGKEKPLSFKLLKVVNEEFVEDGNDKWLIRTNQVKLVKYPIMWPALLGVFTQIVPCSLYMRGRGEPLDWENPPAGVLSSIEAKAVLDPRWLVSLVRGVQEGVKPAGMGRMMAMLQVGVPIVCCIMLFYVITRLNAIAGAMEALKVLVH